VRVYLVIERGDPLCVFRVESDAQAWIALWRSKPDDSAQIVNLELF
jgi:hypothetical protein